MGQKQLLGRRWWLVRLQGGEEGRVGRHGGFQGAARWLLGSAVAIGQVVKPLGGLTM